MKTYLRYSKPLDKMVPVLGSEIDTFKCRVCSEIKNQKHFHLVTKNNFEAYRLRTTCGPCYNRDRKVRRGMDIVYTLPLACDICNIKKELFPDHSHITHLHRGWLCRSCNTAIGQLGDTVKGLEKARQYLIERDKHEIIN